MTLRALLATLPLFLIACAPHGPFDGVEPEADAAREAAVEAGDFNFIDGSAHDAAPVEAAVCDPPDMLVVLDRSCSMDAMVGTLGTRLEVAKSALTFITKPPTDSTLRFGLELLPDDSATCGPGKLVVPNGLNSSSSIDKVLSTLVESCNTPIGSALQAAATTLSAVKVSGRDQYVMLVTDGGEICQTTDQVTAIAQAMDKAGIHIYVVGFGGDDDPVLLNNIACAGHTATNFATDCTCTSAGCTTASTVNSTTTPLYFRAADGPTLQKSLATITNQACCGCNLPVN